MSTKPTPGAGDVEVEFDGRKMLLKPTLRAIQEISNTSEGIAGALARVQRLEFKTIALCMAVGMDLTDNALEGFEQKLFKEGINKYVVPLTKYLMILSNGGQPVERKRDEDTQGAAGNE